MIVDESPEFVVGLIAPRWPHEEVVERLTRLDRPAEQIGRNIAGNRSLLVADRHLRAAAPDPVLEGARAAYRQWLELAERRRSQIDDTRELLDSLSLRHGIPIWGIKGLAARAAYPEPAQRQLSDADVAVRSQEQAFRLAALLRAKGFVTDDGELPWFKETLDGDRYGQYRLLPPDGLLSVDIHFGPGYSVGHCGLLPIPMPHQPGMHPLPMVDNLAPMLGNSGGDVHVTAKDVNDLWVACGDLPVEASDALVRAAEAAGFARHLRGIASVALEVTRLEGRRLEAVRRLACGDDGARRRVILASGNRPVGTATRAARTAVSAYHQARSMGLGAVKAAAVGVGALAYYSAPVRVRVLPVPATAMPTPRPWRCVRLVPLALAAAGPQGWAGDALSVSDGADAEVNVTGDLREVEVDGRARLLAQDDALFLPTVWYVLPSATVAGARRSKLSEAPAR